MSVNDVRVFIFKKCYKRISFLKKDNYYSKKRLKRKDLLLLASKLIEKAPDPCNAKEHYQSFLRKKNRKLIKQSEIITHQLKHFENSNADDIISDITEGSKTLYKFKSPGL